jgi:hypothetical protein
MRRPRKVTVDEIKTAIAAELTILSAAVRQFEGRDDVQGAQVRNLYSGQISALMRVEDMIRNRTREL